MKPCLTFLVLALCIASSVLPLYPEDMNKSVAFYVNNLGVNPDKSIFENTSYKNSLIRKSGAGDLPLTAFGNLGYDIYCQDSGGIVKGLVGSPVEYYYTDLVFVKQDYATALKALFSQRMEDPGKNTECCSAIIFIIEYAAKRGVAIKSADVESAWRKEKTAEIIYYARKNNCNDGGVKLITDYYFGGIGYSEFTARLKSLSERDMTAAVSVLAVIESLNTKFAGQLSGALGW